MRNVKVFALMGVIAVTAAGCGQKQEAAPKNDTSVAAETSQMAETGQETKEEETEINEHCRFI